MTDGHSLLAVVSMDLTQNMFCSNFTLKDFINLTPLLSERSDLCFAGTMMVAGSGWHGFTDVESGLKYSKTKTGLKLHLNP